MNWQEELKEKKNMSHPIFEANEESPYGNVSRDEFYKKHQIIHQESFMINDQKMKIYTQSWQPNCSNPKGFVGMVHGYNSESGWLFELNAVAIAKAGYLVCALDLQGHGYSDGKPRGYIPNMDSLVSDCISYFNTRRREYEEENKNQNQNQNLPAFLYGESMGGAICILISLRHKGYHSWNGMILSGAMCDISKKFKPIWPLEKLLPVAAFFAPRWRISCAKSPGAKGSTYKEKWKKKLVSNSPNLPENGKPPAATAKELMRVCKVIREECRGLEVPMLIMHGENDTVCDPEAAKFVFQLAGSKDKTMKIFPGMWHQLIGEPNQSVQMVFHTMMDWIQLRTALAKKSK